MKPIYFSQDHHGCQRYHTRLHNRAAVLQTFERELKFKKKSDQTKFAKNITRSFCRDVCRNFCRNLFSNLFEFLKLSVLENFSEEENFSDKINL